MKYKMNKKGEFLLRNMVVLLVIFSLTVGLISLFVEDMANEYNDNTMKNEYFNSGVNDSGRNVSENVYSDVEDMQDSLDDMSLIDGGGFVVTKVVDIVKKIVFAPTYFAGSISGLLKASNVPNVFVATINIGIQTILYGLIIFIIITAALRGSKV